MRRIWKLTAFSVVWALALVGAGLRYRAKVDLTDDYSLVMPPTDDSYVGSGEPMLHSALSHREVTRILLDRLGTLSEDRVARLASHFLGLCKKHQFDPAFLLSLIDVESQFNIRAQSPKGAVGLMQLMPATAAHVWRGLGLNPLRTGASSTRIIEDPFVNLSLGVAYLSELRDKYRNRPAYYLVSAYNLGPAKLDELMARPGFKPVKSGAYYREIRKRMKHYLSYRDARLARAGNRLSSTGVERKNPQLRGLVCKLERQRQFTQGGL